MLICLSPTVLSSSQSLHSSSPAPLSWSVVKKKNKKHPAFGYSHQQFCPSCSFQLLRPLRVLKAGQVTSANSPCISCNKSRRSLLNHSLPSPPQKWCPVESETLMNAPASPSQRAYGRVALVSPDNSYYRLKDCYQGTSGGKLQGKNAARDNNIKIISHRCNMCGE